MIIPIHENISINNNNFPVRIKENNNNSNARGCQFHWHEMLEFYVVYSGGVKLHCNGRYEWLYKDDIGFVNWCEPHRGMEFLDNTKHYIVQFDLGGLLNETATFDEEKYLFSIINSGIDLKISQDKELMDIFKSMISQFENKNIGYELSVKGYSLIIISLLLQRANKTYDSKNILENQSLQYMKETLMYIHRNLDKKICVNDIAKKLHITQEHLTRLFKKYTGETILSYVNTLRCTRAITYLENGQSVMEVASIVGYDDYNYFSRIFKKIIGKSPRTYKNKE